MFVYFQIVMSRVYNVNVRSMHQQIGQICGSCLFLSANALLWTLEKVQYHWISYRNNVLNVLGRMLINLGITVADDLKPRAHINKIVTKAHQRANALLFVW